VGLSKSEPASLLGGAPDYPYSVAAQRFRSVFLDGPPQFAARVAVLLSVAGPTR
jgi:hypothetical protein